MFALKIDNTMKGSPDIAVRIVSSSLSGIPSVPISFATVLRYAVDSATKGVATKTLFHIVSQNRHLNPHTLLLLVAHVPEASSLSFEEAGERCAAFLSDRHGNSRSSCILLLQPGGCRWDDNESSPQSVFIVLSIAREAILHGAQLSDYDQRNLEEKSPATNPSAIATHTDDFLSWARLPLRWPQWHGYKTISSTTSPESSPLHWRRRLIVCGSLIVLGIVVLASTLLALRSRTDGMYDRYDTTGSEGPRHQLRIYWQNASSWAAANPQDNGKWKVRIDDQAIIPASLYDEDEERYQQWYRTRYPEMQQVIDNRDYVRPSWMGSLNMMVPWDDQFHFAHCVLALRRYWKAKETGRHVCGRDIDYLHIDHCLGSLEKRVFIDGPREESQGMMYWQTKACF